MPGRGARAGPRSRTAGGIGGFSWDPPNLVHEFPAAVPQRIRGGEAVLVLVRLHGRLDFFPRHVLVVDSDPDHFPTADVPCVELEPLDFLLDGGHRPRDDIASERTRLSCRCVYHQDSGGDRKSTPELQSQSNLVCRRLLEKKKTY